MSHHHSTVPECPMQPSTLLNDRSSQTYSHPHTDGCRTTLFNHFSLFLVACFFALPLHPYRHWRVTIVNEIKHILSSKQHTHMNHPLIPILSIKRQKFRIQITVSTIHL